MSTQLLTLDGIARTPEIITCSVTIPSGEQMLFRPLFQDDVARLAVFLTGLSSGTRRYHSYPGYDLSDARDLCESINHFDKLHLAVLAQAQGDPRIVGMFRLGFALVDSDKWRYLEQGIELSEVHDCRFSACIADGYQGQGLGSEVFPHVADIARGFGKQRMILLGGVLADNARAIHFYQKHGFRLVSTFKDAEGQDCLDMMLQLK